jgi:hypothetical protein
MHLSRLLAPIGLVTLAVVGLGPGQSRPALAADSTVTFGCLGFPQFFSVPPGVTQITVNAEGAAGGECLPA